jgi:hypothetical protein
MSFHRQPRPEMPHKTEEFLRLVIDFCDEDQGPFVRVLPTARNERQQRRALARVLNEENDLVGLLRDLDDNAIRHFGGELAAKRLKLV